MELFNSLISHFIKKRIPQIECMINDPHQLQSNILQSLIKKGKNTFYGKKYRFDQIHTYNEYREQVPVISYEELYPMIDRIMKGEQQVLWPSCVKWFAKSSGTTNAKSKFIPVTQETLDGCHFKAGKDLLAIYYRNYSEAQMFMGKGLIIGGSHQVNRLSTSSRSFFGDISAVLLSNTPWWFSLARTPSLKIALMDRWEEKIDKIIEKTTQENVTNISGVPTWIVVLFERMMKRRGMESMLDIWPNLEVFFHGAVSFDPYRSLFKKMIPTDKMRYMEIYNASEGFFGLQDQINSNDLLLMLDHGVYYEFIPMDEIDKEGAQALSLEEVEVGKNYSLIITTNSGLWRYKIGDTLRFTSVNPYRIKISGRTKHFINAFGEELIIENAEQAIIKACEETGAEIDNYTAAPIYLGQSQKGGHEWIIEFSTLPQDLEFFRNILDARLKKINSDYEAKREKDIALLPPTIKLAPSGTFYRWMKSKGKLGGQNKVPRLSNDRTYVEELDKLIQEIED